MENEIWKEYPNNSDYSVSSLGRVKVKTRIGNSGRKRIGRILSQTTGTHVYLLVKINQKTRKVHQLVAETFLGHKPNGMKLVVNHKDFDRTNNRVDNLEIVTHRENTNRKHLKSSSKYVGVHWSKPNKKWVSKISVDGSRKHLGYFKCELAAARAYQKALKEL